MTGAKYQKRAIAAWWSSIYEPTETSDGHILCIARGVVLSGYDTT